jgi:hypothetical protein
VVQIQTRESRCRDTDKFFPCGLLPFQQDFPSLAEKNNGIPQGTILILHSLPGLGGMADVILSSFRIMVYQKDKLEESCH